jgi:hypothetical protein
MRGGGTFSAGRIELAATADAAQEASVGKGARPLPTIGGGGHEKVPAPFSMPTIGWRITWSGFNESVLCRTLLTNFKKGLK